MNDEGKPQQTGSLADQLIDFASAAHFEAITPEGADQMSTFDSNRDSPIARTAHLNVNFC